MLVVKSCVELLSLCGLNNLVVFLHRCVLIRLQTIPTTKNIRSATLGACRWRVEFKELLSTVNQERITTWKEVAVLWKQVVASERAVEF